MPQDNRTDDQSKEVVGASPNNPPVDDKKSLGGKDSKQDEAYRKLQSRADQAEAMLKKIEPFIPVIELLDKKPELYSVLEKAAFPEQRSEPKDERPKMPVKPANYNHAEAVTDPNSESYKFKAALDDYHIAYAEYNERQEQKRDQERQQKLERERQQQAMEQQRQKTIADLREMGLTNDEINDFFAVMTSKDSLEPKFMVGYWQHLRGRNIIDHKNKQLDVLARRSEVTAGTDINQTGPTPKISDEQGFNAFMKASARKIVEHRR